MSTPEIITVNSEALEAQIRELLPSQRGFGSELQASNVITPIIDLTAAAEGSGLPTELQTAWDFSTTRATANAETTTIVSTPGFYKVEFTAEVNAGGAAEQQRASLLINDGSSTATIWSYTCSVGTGDQLAVISDTIYVFLRAGDSLQAFSVANSNTIDVVARQVASVVGLLNDPLGFVQE